MSMFVHTLCCFYRIITHTHARTHARIHTRTHARTHSHTRARTHARTHSHTHTHTHAHTHTHTHTHVRTHAHTHTHTHTHTHHTHISGPCRGSSLSLYPSYHSAVSRNCVLVSDVSSCNRQMRQGAATLANYPTNRLSNGTIINILLIQLLASVKQVKYCK